VTPAEIRKRHLEQELGFIRRRLGAGRVDALTRTPDDAEDAARAAVRELSLVAREQLLARRRALQEAMARIANGTYGLCAQCGDPIGERRLDALPEALHCLPCQEQRDRDASRRPAHRSVTEEDDDV
jgi:DnaK suppressor protein